MPVTARSRYREKRNFLKSGFNIMKKTVLKILLYSACAGLIVFYAITLKIGGNPDVAENYRAFYIDHTIDEWPGE